MSDNQKIKFITLGCKVNQYETQGMRELMKQSGVQSVHASSSDPVEFVVVNTCTVTAEADRENRYWIRRARREHPNARIIVTGCGVERNRADYEKLPEVDLVLRNHEKDQIASRLLEGCASPSVQDAMPQAGPVNPKHLFTPLSISETEGAGRAFIKIQDGCNHACSFCKVVLVRGRSRSRMLPDIVEEVTRLRDSGYREIVFAGIQLGAYGLDFDPAASYDLIRVLEACSKVEGIERLRLSSIEPTDVEPELIRALRDIPKCCHQLHIPLQSGDDDVLKGMNRRYGRDFYIDLIARLKDAMPDFCLTLDVMAGFPNETDEAFENTIRLLQTVKPLKCHVFPYSSREGTRAALLKNLAPEVIKQRVHRLIEEGQRFSEEVRRPYLGQTMTVLTESFRDSSGQLQGLTPNYLKVNFPGFEDQVGQMISVKLETLSEDGFFGTID